jgi:hypothetical protein
MVISIFRPKLNLFKPVSIAPLVVFRIIFGALLLFGGIRFLYNGWVDFLYIQPKIYFGYLGFEWVNPLPGIWMYLPFILFLIGSLGILLGAFYKFSSTLVFLTFTYIELLDKTNYLNHYYFISLITFLLIWVPAHKSYSLDVRLKRVESLDSTPSWTITIFKFQLAIVYIFAGIAKIEYDWLIQAQPLKIWLQAHRELPIVGKFLATEWVAYFFSWFGCIYDLFIVFFLLNKSTRVYAYICVLIFHIVTWYLLPIGIFPWIMICSTLLFFNSNFHEKFLHILKKFTNSKNPLSSSNIKQSNKLISFFLLVFVVFQISIPFRYVLYPGNLFWTEEGFRFSWRVMLMHKEGSATFYVKDSKTKREIEIRNSDYLTEIQEDQMSTQPDMILQYAQFLKSTFKDSLIQVGTQKIYLRNPSIHANIYVSLNGRNSQLYVSKKHDLSKFPYNLKHRNWLEPMME